jgi:hypothetical protein
MRSPLTVQIVVLLIGAVISFLVGRKYGALTADWNAQRRVVLTEDMVLLSVDNKPTGRIPSGTTLYGVPDPWGDKNSTFKLYLQTDSNDEIPVQPRKSGGPREHDVYRLKSMIWMEKMKHARP